MLFPLVCRPFLHSWRRFISLHFPGSFQSKQTVDSLLCQGEGGKVIAPFTCERLTSASLCADIGNSTRQSVCALL
jgi:hypothetical protein